MKTDASEYLSLLQEIQNNNVSTFTIMPADEPRFTIDSNSRNITVPSEFSFLSVQNDHKAETIYFEIDRYFDDVDLSQHTCVIQFINKSGSTINEGTYPVTSMDIDSVDGKIVFGWEICNDATQLTGDITFSVRFYSIDDNGNFTYNFNTLTANSFILPSLNIISGGEKITATELEIWTNKMNNLASSIEADIVTVEEKLTELENSIASIPEDYTALTEEVDKLSGEIADVNSDIESIANDNYLAVTNSTMEKGKYMNYSGVLGENSAYNYINIPVVEGEKYLVDGYTYANLPLCLLRNGENVVKTYPQSITANYEHLSVEIIIPNGVNTLTMNVFSRASYSSKIYKISGKELGKVKYTNLSNEFSKAFVKEFENMDLEWSNGVYYTTNGFDTLAEHTAFKCASLSVSKNDVLKITTRTAYTNARAYCLVDIATKHIIDVFGEYTDKMSVFEVEYTVQSDGILYINSDVNYDAKVEKMQFVKSANTNVLDGKIALFNGDSICYGAGTGWASRIGKKNNMVWKNYGISGGTITSNTYGDDGTARHWVSTDIANMASEYPNADYVILESCLNDGFNKIPIGELSDGYTDNFDHTTFSGAVEYMLQQAITLFPKAKIGVIIPHRVTNDLSAWHEFVRSACKKWSISFIDLYYESGLCVNNETQKSIMFRDATHLTDAGYDHITPKIEAWMKTL